MGTMAQGGGNPFASLLGALGGFGGQQQPQFGQGMQQNMAAQQGANTQRASFRQPRARGNLASVAGRQQMQAQQPSLLQQVGMSNLQRGAQQQRGFQQAQQQAQQPQQQNSGVDPAIIAKFQGRERAVQNQLSQNRQQANAKKAWDYVQGGGNKDLLSDEERAAMQSIPATRFGYGK